MDVDSALKSRWLGQGFNSTPLIITSAALGIKTMKEHTGLTYHNFLYIIRSDYGDNHYYAKDLEDNGKEIVIRLKENENFFIECKSVWNKHMKDSSAFYNKIIKSDLLKLKEDEIIDLFESAKKHLANSVGVSHLIEPYTLTTDKKIKDQITSYITADELNRVFSILISPTKESFINEYEDEQNIIQKNGLKDEDIKNFMDKYRWIRNSYAGKTQLNLEDMRREIKFFIKSKCLDFEQIKQEKIKIIKRYSLPLEIKKEIELIEFLTLWQDERKKQVLRAIEALELINQEISRRFDVQHKHIRYLLFNESIKKLKNTKFIEELERRRHGCVCIFDIEKPIMLVGDKFRDFVKQFSIERDLNLIEFSGMTASLGTAVGRVKILTNIESIKKVNNGDIIVASMTRPEYVPAMKKASAIITDEGGITCHAAIISRELGIPCIIGTKKATKILKDNYLVEVRGNHGLVIILKK